MINPKYWCFVLFFCTSSCKHSSQSETNSELQSQSDRSYAFVCIDLKMVKESRMERLFREQYSNDTRRIQDYELYKYKPLSKVVFCGYYQKSSSVEQIVYGNRRLSENAELIASIGSLTTGIIIDFDSQASEFVHKNFVPSEVLERIPAADRDKSAPGLETEMGHYIKKPGPEFLGQTAETIPVDGGSAFPPNSLAICLNQTKSYFDNSFEAHVDERLMELNMGAGRPGTNDVFRCAVIKDQNEVSVKFSISSGMLKEWSRVYTVPKSKAIFVFAKDDGGIGAQIEDIKKFRLNK